MTRILVTGVGAIIGYGVLRSLRKANTSFFLVGTDIYADAVGQAWTDAFEQAPLTASDKYKDWIVKIAKQYKINLIIPGIEQDLHFFSANRTLFDEINVKVVLNQQDVIDLSKDKWSVDQELLRLESSMRIPSFLEGTFEYFADTLGLPFILKPRSGYASKGIVYVDGAETFATHSSKLGNILMAQPIIGSKDEEYTVGMFGDGTGKVLASITLQRHLAPDGSTVKAWTKNCDDLNLEVSRLASHFHFLGPTNLQFRRSENGWKLLEINPRFSSSTSLRTAFQYNESLMAVDFYLHGQLITQPALQSGFAIRYIEDVVVYDRNNF